MYSMDAVRDLRATQEQPADLHVHLARDGALWSRRENPAAIDSHPALYQRHGVRR
jgi:hypothetical protein